MKVIAIILIGLFLITVIILSMILKSKNRKERKLNEALIVAEKLHTDTIETMQQQYQKNLNKDIPDGEIILFQEIRRLLELRAYQAFTFYHQLAFMEEDNSLRVDYFLVSPYGLWVIESKHWNGVTYLYHQVDNIFTATQYAEFGKGKNSSLEISVFNVNRETEDQLKVSRYQNPVTQARKYSLKLSHILNKEPVNNMIVFNSGVAADGEKRELRFNDMPLAIEQPDSYTTILTNIDFRGFFSKIASYQPKYSAEQLERIHHTISEYCSFHFKVNVDNIHQIPFPLLKLYQQKA